MASFLDSKVSEVLQIAFAAKLSADDLVTPLGGNYLTTRASDWPIPDMRSNEDMPMSAQAAPPTNERIPISLVDDDTALRRRLQLLLRASNYDVRAYSAPETLLADPGSRTSACLISDLYMPGMDGFTLLRSLRAGGWSGPAILITSSHDPDLSAKAAVEGFHTVLIKPLADRVVLDAVQSAVGLAQPIELEAAQ